jgi:MFS family permease
MSRPRIFYGWWIVLACLLIQAIAAGSTTYMFSLFAGEVERSFDSTRATVMLAATGHGIAMGLLAPRLGIWLDRYSIRRLVTISAVVMGAGFWVISFSPSVWGFVGSYTLLVPVGSATLTMLFAPMLLSRWFARHRGLAIGIAALGTQLGGLTLPPLVAYIIEIYDWRIAMRAVGVLCAGGVALLAYVALIDSPSQRNLLPDGDAQAKAPLSAAERQPTSDDDGSLRSVLRDRTFWLAALGMSIIIATFSVVLSNLSMLATDIGTSREAAALLISLFAFVGMISSPLAGRLCDLIDIRLMLSGILVVTIVAVAIFAAADSYRQLALAAGLIGFSGGAVSPFFGAMIGRLFALSVYGRVIGSMSFFSVTAAAAAPVASGWLFDWTGSYRDAFLVLLVLLAVPLTYASRLRRRVSDPA